MADIVELGVRYRAEGHETVKQANRDIATTGKAAETATKELEEAQKDRARADKDATAGAKAVTTATKETTAATTGATRATNTNAQATTGATRATEGSTRATTATTTALRREQAQAVNTTRAVSGMAASTKGAAAANQMLEVSATGATRAMSGFDTRGILQQTSQIVQQTAATGQLMQAVSIQAADIGMYFGAVGTAVGMAATVLLPLAGNLFDATEEAKSLEDALSDLTGATADYRDAADLSRASVADLTEEFGSQADAIRDTLDLLAQLSLQDALDALSDAASAASEGLEDVRNMVTAIAEGRELMGGGRFALFETDFQEMSRELGLTLGQMQQLVATFDKLGEAKGPDEITEAARDLNALLLDIYGTAEDIPQEFRAMAMAAAQVDVEATKIKATTEELADETGNVTDGLSRASSEARSLADWLGVSLETAERFAAIGDWGVPNNIGRGGDPREMGGSFIDWQTQDVARFDDLYQAAERGILDLIAVAEGTARGDGYNETLDYGRWTGGDVDLVNMTLREVRALQDQMRTPENRAIYGDGAGSSAVGRYQIVGMTLDDLMEWLGLDGGELFSPEMQDRMAQELIRRQGADAGTWASFANVPQNLITKAMGQQSIPQEDAGVTRAREMQARADEAASRKAEQAEDARARALEQTQAGYDRVRASLDPLVALQQDYEDAIEAVNAAERAGIASAEEAAAARAGIMAEYQEALAEAQKQLDERGADLGGSEIENIEQGYKSLTQTLLETARASGDVGAALRDWLADATLKAMARDLGNTIMSIGGGGGFFGSIMGWLTASAKGNAFDSGQVMAFAKGGAFTNGIATQPTLAPMALFGEAGPEAIMPLVRAMGGYGVRTDGGGMLPLTRTGDGSLGVSMPEPQAFAMGGVLSGGVAAPEVAPVPRLASEGQGGVQHGAPQVSMSMTIDARGAQQGVADQIARKVEAMRPQLVRDAVKAMYQSNREVPLR